jgi:hypothetical protein
MEVIRDAIDQGTFADAHRAFADRYRISRGGGPPLM